MLEVVNLEHGRNQNLFGRVDRTHRVSPWLANIQSIKVVSWEVSCFV